MSTKDGSEPQTRLLQAGLWFDGCQIFRGELDNRIKLIEQIKILQGLGRDL
jgi:hypothetical protein